MNEELKQFLEAMEGRINKRFDNMENRFSEFEKNTDKRFDILAEQIHRININIDRIQTDTYDIKKELRHQRADINYLEEKAQIKHDQ
jgi:hypothetical protein